MQVFNMWEFVSGSWWEPKETVPWLYYYNKWVTYRLYPTKIMNGFNITQIYNLHSSCWWKYLRLLDIISCVNCSSSNRSNRSLLKDGHNGTSYYSHLPVSTYFTAANIQKREIFIFTCFWEVNAFSVGSVIHFFWFLSVCNWSVQISTVNSTFILCFNAGFLYKPSKWWDTAEE